MQFRKTIFVVLLSVILLSGCSWFSGEEDVVSMSLLPKVENKFKPKMVWHCSVGSGSGDFYATLHPAWQGDRVFVADRRGVVKALDADSGKEIWSTNLSMNSGFFLQNRSAQLSGGLAAADSRVYVGSELAKVYALDVQDGSVAWETTVSGEALSTPVVSNSMVLIHTSNGMLEALNKENGEAKWILNLDMPLLTLRGESSPTTAFSVAIVGGDNGRVSAVMINQGMLIWQQQISKVSGGTEIARINDVQTTPVVINGVVYAVAYNGNLVALDLRSGQVIWSMEISSVSNLLIDDRRIYLVDQNDHVVAVDIQGGIILWCQSKLAHRKLTSPVFYQGYIVTGDSEGYLHWMNTDDGGFVAQKKVDSSGLLAIPVVADDKLIIQSKNGEIYAISG